MFLWKRPTDETVRSLLERQSSLPFSYTEVGSSRSMPPTGYNIDHNRVQLGQGERAFKSAIAAIRQWRMFSVPGVELCWPDARLEPGTIVAVRVAHLGFWSLNFCRIIYLIDDKGAVERFGFGYGTLAEHAERGEERFKVEWNRADDSVWYDILAFSRPAALLTRLAYPYSRERQEQFARESLRAMKAAVATTDHHNE